MAETTHKPSYILEFTPLEFETRKLNGRIDLISH